MTWHPVCAITAIANGARAFTVEGREIVVWRLGLDEFYCLDRWCGHQGEALESGQVDEDELEIECARHGMRFSLQTGDAVNKMQCDDVYAFETAVRDGSLYVDIPEGLPEQRRGAATR